MSLILVNGTLKNRISAAKVQKESSVINIAMST